MLKALQYLWSKCTKNLLPQKYLAVSSSPSQSNAYSSSPTNLSIIPLCQHEEPNKENDSWYQDQHNNFFHQCQGSGGILKWVDFFAFSSILAGAGSTCRIFHQWQCERRERNEEESGCYRHFLIRWIRQHSNFGIFSPEYAIYSSLRIKTLPDAEVFSCEDRPSSSSGPENDHSCASSRLSEKKEVFFISANKELFSHQSMDEKWNILPQKSFGGSILESIPSTEESQSVSSVRESINMTESFASTSNPPSSGSSKVYPPHREDHSPPLSSQENKDPISVLAVFMAHSLNAQGVAAMHDNSWNDVVGEQLWHQSCSLMAQNGGYVPSQYNLATLFHQRARRCHQLGEHEKCIALQKQAEQWYRLAWNKSGQRHVKTAYNLAVLLQEMVSDENESASEEVISLMKIAAAENIEGAKEFLAMEQRRISTVMRQKMRFLHQSKSSPNFKWHFSSNEIQKHVKPFHKDDLETHVLSRIASSCQSIAGRERFLQIAACVH